MTLTHHEATFRDRKGFCSPCPGVLKEIGAFRDRYLDAGVMCERTITVLGCECGKFLSIDSEGDVLNVYERGDAARLAAELAASLGLDTQRGQAEDSPR